MGCLLSYLDLADGSGVTNRNGEDPPITRAVSTSLDSTVLLIGKGVESNFTRNTFSKDVFNPWLIHQGASFRQCLVEKIDQSWGQMEISPEEDRDEVKKIAPHIVYELSNDGWKQVQITNNIVSNKTVRFELDSIVIWSHPPRDAPLTSALEAKNGYRKMRGQLVSKGYRYRSQGEKTEDLNSLAKFFTKFYKKFYEGLDETLLNSYKWPTLQLLLKRKGIVQRYGNTFAGVYDRCDNEVHHKFAAKGVEERKLPAKKEVFEQFVKSVEFEAIEAIGQEASLE